MDLDERIISAVDAAASLNVLTGSLFKEEDAAVAAGLSLDVFGVAKHLEGLIFGYMRVFDMANPYAIRIGCGQDTSYTTHVYFLALRACSIIEECINGEVEWDGQLGESMPAELLIYEKWKEIRLRWEKEELLSEWLDIDIDLQKEGDRALRIARDFFQSDEDNKKRKSKATNTCPVCGGPSPMTSVRKTVRHFKCSICSETFQRVRK